MSLHIRLILLSAAALFFLLTIESCSDPDPEDTQTPTVEFLQASQSQFTGTVNLDFVVTDNNSIASIKIFIDNDLVADKTGTSAKMEFNLSWDSKSVADGAHVLKVSVTDAGGNQLDVPFTITVKNTLLTVFVPGDYVYSDASWLFLSDHAGNLLGAKQLHNNTEVAFPMIPGFDDETIMVHFFNYYHTTANEGAQSINSRYFSSYSDIPVEDFHFLSSTTIPPTPYDGHINITINDVASGYLNPEMSGTEIGQSEGHYESEDAYTYSTHITKAQADILVIFYHPDGSAKYKLFEATKDGDDIAVSFSDFTDMKVDLLTTTGAQNIYQLEVGFRPEAPIGEGFVYNLYQVNEPTDNIRSYQPKDGVFSKYISISLANYDDEYWYITQSDLPHSTFKKSDATVVSQDFSDGKIQLSLTGTGTMIRIASSGQTYGETLNVFDSWGVTVPHKSTIAYKLPPIPAEILALYYPDGSLVYPFYKIQFENYLIGRSYEKFTHDFLNPEGFVPPADYELVRKIVDLTPEPETGRMGNSAKHNHGTSDFIPDHLRAQQNSDRTMMTLLNKMKHPW